MILFVDSMRNVVEMDFCLCIYCLVLVFFVKFVLCYLDVLLNKKDLEVFMMR